MQKLIFLFAVVLSVFFAQAQTAVLKVVNAQGEPLPNSTVELLSKDSSLLKAQMTADDGTVSFHLTRGSYFWRISRVGYTTHFTPFVSMPDNTTLHIPDIVLQTSGSQLSNITVSAKKPFIELKSGKTIVNVESSITAVGATAMEVLEKLPGITVDKDGNIALKGKSGVTVMVDGKQTYLDASQLSTLLNGMSASQIGQVEIIDQPSARYDAAGNAGIINIKTKKNQQKGFNGSISTTYGQGRYPKNNNNLQLNYRTGQWNFFLTYSANFNRSFTRIDALRTYFEPDEKTVISFLEQPSFLNGKGYTHTLRTGVDHTLSNNTNIGLALTGLSLGRKSNGDNTALWMNANRETDSLLQTKSNNNNNWKNGGVNVNFKHAFTANRQLTADVDWLGYRIRGDQFFENTALLPITYTEASRANLPSGIHILSAKADYAEQLDKIKLEGGWKTSHITTDNLAAYENRNGNEWQPDFGRTNHFLYTENIHALYASAETKMKRWTLQGGLRYEMTAYEAAQLGNIVVKDSSFSRNYNSLFPSLFTSFEMDSANTFSLSAGRRIDRPPFQKLNPFLFIINKYTYQQGNPFYRPQYTWNMELSHSYKGILLTSASYSITKDYFSQVFPIDSNGIVIYTEGNLDRLQNFGLSVGTQISPVGWWSLSAQGIVLHKKMEGFIEKQYRSSVTQFNLNLTNSFRFKKGWSAELSGFYTSKSQNDIQEVVDPAGQLSLGVSKNVIKNKGLLKLAARDIFYTQWMKGLTHFQRATEYFKLTRDTRIVTVSFIYRFGRSFKTIKRSEGAAGEEIQRVGNG
ncbi:MAG: outer membrane beta-barrel protein [Flavisolibacter sp.]